MAPTSEESGRPDEAWSVVVKGRTTELKRLDEVVDVGDLPLHPWHASPKGRFVRILPDEVTGRRFPVADASAWETPLSGTRRTPHE